MSFGKIYWICDDFSFNGTYFPKTDETSHSVSQVENCVIQEHMIKLVTVPIDFGHGEIGYAINLNIDQFGKKYIGNFSVLSDPDTQGKVECELFENKREYFLFGKWVESDLDFTWFAKLKKQ